MSRKVATLVYAKQAGSMARKAVLAYFADRANDDGSGIWTAKQRIADEIECSKQTVITTVKALVADGLVSESGRRPNGNGYTVEYAINLAAIEALPDSKRDIEGVQILTRQDLDGSTSLTARGQAALPKPSLNRPISPKASPSTRTRAKADPAFHRMPEDWKPVRFSDDTVARAIVDRRGRDWARAALESFRNWAANANDRVGRKREWQKAWINWVIEQDRKDGRSSHGMGGNRSYRSSSGFGRTVDAAERAIALTGG